jgi:ankyrin repeat protein
MFQLTRHYFGLLALDAWSAVVKFEDTAKYDRSRTNFCSFHPAELLVNQSANIEAKTKLGDTPLSLAAYFNMTEVVQMLVERGANIHAADIYGRWSIQSISREVYLTLFFPVGITSLHSAAYTGSLSSGKATLSLPPTKNRTVLDVISEMRGSVGWKFHYTFPHLATRLNLVSVRVNDGAIERGILHEASKYI